MRSSPSEAQKAFIQSVNELVKRFGFFLEAEGCCGELLLMGGKPTLDVRYDYDEERYEVF